MNENTIPLIDVTDSDTDEAQLRAQAKANARSALEKADQFVLLTQEAADASGEVGGTVLVGASDHAMMSMLTTLLCVVGATRMGEKLEALPAELGRAMALAAGFNALAGFVQAAAGPAPAPGSEQVKH